MACGHIVQLTDDSDGIDIAKSGAPEPSPEMRAWLARECDGVWNWDCDSAFNVFFRFEKESDAARFRARWAGPTGT